MTDHGLCPVSTLESLEVVQRLERGLPLEQDILLDPPGDPGPEVVGDVAARGHAEDVVELLQRALPSFNRSACLSFLAWGTVTSQQGYVLGLGQAKEDDHKGDHVQAGVEAKGPRRRDLGQQRGERQPQDAADGVVPADAEGDADLSVRQGEGLGHVDERHGPDAWRVEGREEVDEEGDERDAC
jgi:hypothetical protein